MTYCIFVMVRAGYMCDLNLRTCNLATLMWCSYMIVTFGLMPYIVPHWLADSCPDFFSLKEIRASCISPLDAISSPYYNYFISVLHRNLILSELNMKSRHWWCSSKSEWRANTITIARVAMLTIMIVFTHTC